MTSNYLLHGIPDSRRATIIKATPAGRMTLEVGGGASLLPFLKGEIDFQTITIDADESFPRLKLERRPLINHISDPDQCLVALRHADRIVQLLGTPCFNAPEAVHGTARHMVASKLAGIPGLDVPKTVRFTPKHPDDFARAAQQAGIGYPLLVRLAGDHGGISLVRIDGPADWDKVHALPWGGRKAYLTEYRNFRDKDGKYRKWRIMVTGEKAVLRHAVIADHWLIDGYLRDDAALREEEAALKGYEDGPGRDLAPLIREIGDRLGLDYFGIDGALRPDGTFLLFEANACMAALYPIEAKRDIWKDCIARLKENIVDKLRRPESWRHQGVRH